MEPKVFSAEMITTLGDVHGFFYPDAGFAWKDVEESDIPFRSLLRRTDLTDPSFLSISSDMNR